MFVELHIVQNFAPSNLNRDDSNTPKDCEFGGWRRARISSQCIKRSVRRHHCFIDAVEKAGGDTAVRTRRILARLVEIFENEHGKSREESEKASRTIIDCLGLKLKDEEKTQYLLYFGREEIAELARIAAGAWEVLCAVDVEAKVEGKDAKASKGKKGKKDEAPELKAVREALQAVIGQKRKEARSYAADIALFGRMIADDKNMSVDAACQVAHALSTNKVEMEMDYFTAVDDLLPDEESGSDMIGVVEFNSSCFYRYSNINIGKLRENLGSNDDLLISAVLGYLEASVKAIPTGKQNSMAAQNPAGYARVIVRKGGSPWSLANAFQKPVRPMREESLEERSISALEDYLKRLKDVYGEEGIVLDEAFNVHGSGSLRGMLDSVKTCLKKEYPK